MPVKSSLFIHILFSEVQPIMTLSLTASSARWSVPSKSWTQWRVLSYYMTHPSRPRSSSNKSKICSCSSIVFSLFVLFHLSYFKIFFQHAVLQNVQCTTLEQILNVWICSLLVAWNQYLHKFTRSATGIIVTFIFL